MGNMKEACSAEAKVVSLVQLSGIHLVELRGAKTVELKAFETEYPKVMTLVAH